MNRFVCIHGHFYQPPRENPWLEAVELQDSAFPYHDWNERITAECYEANASSRILDAEGRIAGIVNNYARISFDFGPTLLSWMERKAPETYRAVLEADKASRARFSGHGSALALPYNHMILPLASLRDKRTQVLWGIRDFERRFGRSPEGMWLPETAADLETLEVLAEHGIRFTVLAPHQAARVRAIGATEWTDAGGGRVDPTAPYAVALPGGRGIAVFFYDDPSSRAVAFEGLLSNGEHFARRLAGLYGGEGDRPRLAHVATDGESYGHHHRHGDMALAYALHTIESGKLARLTNYGEFLEAHPPRHEAEILERASWSCPHGLERWREDCGCATGAHPGWHQRWRRPLREALDWLRDELAPRFEREGRTLLADPWAARDAYVQVVLDRSPESLERFFKAHAPGAAGGADRTRALMLLEMQRNAMLMYTSCGWFFDDVSRIETVQVLQYAGRAVQLAESLSPERLEEPFLERLARAPGNVPDQPDGRSVYERFVRPARVDLKKAAAHYAVGAVFADGPRDAGECYETLREDHRVFEAGRARMAVGRVRIASRLTLESARFMYAVLHLGGHDVRAGLQEDSGDGAFAAMAGELEAAFGRAEPAGTLSAMGRRLGEPAYSLESLFRDEKRRVVESILQATVAEVEEEYRRLHAQHAPLMRFLGDLGVPLPRALRTAAEFVLNMNLRRAFAEEALDLERVEALLAEAKAESVPLDAPRLGRAIERHIERLADRLQSETGDAGLLERLDAAAGLAARLPFPVELWRAQNAYYAALQRRYPGFRERAGRGDASARDWCERFQALGRRLRVRTGDG